MPYYITDSAEGCSGWATIKEDGEVMGCHATKDDAIDQALAIAARKILSSWASVQCRVL